MMGMIEVGAAISLALVSARCSAGLIQRWTASRNDQRGEAASDVRSCKWAQWGDTTGSFRYVRRRTRYQVHCPVTYETDRGIGEGVVTDMSQAGWRIQTSIGVQPGTSMTLAVRLTAGEEPVLISRATVHWRGEGAFGISLVALDPIAAARLSDFVSQLTGSPQADTLSVS